MSSKERTIFYRTIYKLELERIFIESDFHSLRLRLRLSSV